MVEGRVRSPVCQFGSHVGGVVVDTADSDVEEFLLDQDAVHQAAHIALAILCLYIWPVLAQRTAIIFDYHHYTDQQREYSLITRYIQTRSYTPTDKVDI